MGAGAVVDRHASRRNTHTDSDHYGETNMGDRKTTLVRLCGTRGSSSKHNNSTCGVNTHTHNQLRDLNLKTPRNKQRLRLQPESLKLSPLNTPIVITLELKKNILMI